MSKKIVGHENFRVIVEPCRLGDFGVVSVSDSLLFPDEAVRSQQYQERCNEIVNQIKRHVDAVGSIRIESDARLVCEFCGAEWTEGNDTYNGGCCGEDQAAYEKQTLASLVVRFCSDCEHCGKEPFDSDKSKRACAAWAERREAHFKQRGTSPDAYFTTPEIWVYANSAYASRCAWFKKV